MAFDPAPTVVFTGWSEDGTNITLPITSLPELTAIEADAVTGDSRKMIFAILEQLVVWYNALAVADRPSKITVAANNSAPVAGEYIRTYTIRIYIATGATEVADEPA